MLPIGFQIKNALYNGLTMTLWHHAWVITYIFTGVILSLWTKIYGSTPKFFSHYMHKGVLWIKNLWHYNKTFFNVKHLHA